MKVWVLYYNWAVRGENGSRIEIFASLADAKEEFRKAVKEDKEDNYKHAYNNPNSGYMWEEAEYSWDIWEEGCYCENHSLIFLTEREVR